MAEVTPEDIATELGRDTPAQDSQTFQQWESWILRAERMIARAARRRETTIDNLDPEVVSDVIAQAVAALVRRPEAGSTSTEVRVDDGSTTKRFEKSAGIIVITSEMWAELFPPEDQPRRRPRVGTIRLALPPHRIPGGGMPR